MASISKDPNGLKRIQFIGADSKRKTIRLGKASLRYAESVKVKVEDLVAASITCHAPADDTSRWLTNLDDAMYGKLANVGLVMARGAVRLGPFTRTYIDGRKDIKPRTKINLDRARTYLLSFFAADLPMRNITPGDAENFRMHLIGEGKAENTIRRAIGRARQFFNAAKSHGLLVTNPFDGISVAMRTNQDRFHFISREDAQKVIDACPDVQWKLIFTLARFGGLRCTSDVLALSWDDVNWEHSRIRIPSPKTEHHEGGESRMIPLFPELRPHLLEAFEDAEPGTKYVITRYRDIGTNLRTQMHRIINKAGLEPWPKTFQNLRSTRQTELAEEFPSHVVCKWLGNSQLVATNHYLQLTDEHFAKAIIDNEQPDSKAAHNAAQKAHETTGIDEKVKSKKENETDLSSASFESYREPSDYFTNAKVPCIGLEPITC
ncbi:MAG: tyrosine-type recombinase/integrase [Planctomycetes bacterium]|nr:tyrosine-type recombinase/integrase [Planctomycetota bacterium]